MKRRTFLQQTVAALFAAQAAASTQAVALVCGERQLSYGELEERANRLAHHLRTLGVGPVSAAPCRLSRPTVSYLANRRPGVVRPVFDLPREDVACRRLWLPRGRWEGLTPVSS